MGYQNPSAQERVRAIHCAVDHGLTSIDTAPLYGCGESERIVGEAIRGRRSTVQVLTKCGLRWDTAVGTPMFPVVVDGRPGRIFRSSRPESLREEVDASLARLQTDFIDLIQIHRWDPDVPIEDSVGALIQLRDEGKVGEIGLSDHPVEQMRRAHQSIPGGLFSTQNEYNLILSSQSHEVLDEARTLKIAFLSYSSLAQGLLAGRDKGPPPGDRQGSRYFHQFNLEQLAPTLKGVAYPLAEKYHATLAQLSLAWLLAQEGITAAITGGRSEAQIIENIGALDLAIEPKDLKRLDDAFLNSGWRGEPDASPLQRAKGKARSLLKRLRS